MRYILLILVLSCLACSPKLKPTMSVPLLPPPPSAAGSSAHGEVLVDSLRDARGEQALATFEAQRSLPATDVGLAVQDAITAQLRARGFKIAITAPIAISGEVRRWHAEISRGGQIFAEASIFLEVLDPANKRIYSGTYQGNSSRQGASVEQDDIDRSLSTAMGEAVKQIASDQQLMNLLASF